MSDLRSDTEALRDRLLKLTPATVEKPTLVYFDIIGIAWPIRALLHLAKVDYDLIQISIGQWMQSDAQGNRLLRPCFTNGHVPLYLDSEVRLNQSALILQYLADRHGLIAAEGAERTAALEVMAHAYDALFSWSGILPVTVRIGMSDEETQRRLDAFMGEAAYGLATDGYRLNLAAFVRYLEANPSASGYFVGDSLTVADLQAFNVLHNWYKAFAPELFGREFPQLDAFTDRMKALPGIRDYIDNHQERTTWFKLPDVAIRLTSEDELKALG